MTRLGGPAVKQAQRFAREPVDLPDAETVRATGHKHVRCVCCGRHGTTLLRRVHVEAIDDGRRTVIVLCQPCACSEDRVWRLRWRAVR
jgi:hypothetical protein